MNKRVSGTTVALQEVGQLINRFYECAGTLKADSNPTVLFG